MCAYDWNSTEVIIYKVRFNDQPQYPQIELIVEEVTKEQLQRPTPE
jgi:hypothetical protein